MRCKQAREYYFRNRDGLLSETDKMKLQEHLALCSECAKFVKEMDMTLGLLSELEELSPSESFEWNIKRRILQEKTRLIREGERERKGILYFAKFIGAASVAAALVIISLFAFMKAPETGIKIAQNDRKPQMRVGRPEPVKIGHRDNINFVSTGRPATARMVSQTVGGYGEGYRSTVVYPFETVGLSRDDSLMWENAILRKRVNELEREVLYLRRIIQQMQLKNR